jgi:hypothetical protein
MGLPTPTARKASNVTSRERKPVAVCRTDDWIRELFAGTYDLREADARRRSEQDDRAAGRRETPRDER